MTSFLDNQGQKWTLKLTLGKTRRLAESLGLDLLVAADYMRVVSSLTDRLAFVFLLVQPQADELEINADEFEERLWGDEFAYEASKAFLEETAVFFQKLGQKGLAALATQAIEQMATGRAKLLEMMATGELDSVLQMGISPANPSGSESSSSQPSPESTPGP